MKYSLLVGMTSLFLLGACQEEGNQQGTEHSTDSVQASHSSVALDDSQDLLDLFQTSADSVRVSTQIEDPASDDFTFKGTPIPGHLAHYFDGLQAYGTFDNATDMYATQKVALNKHYTALLVRVPGMYWSSRINIFIFDNDEGILTGDVLEIADNYGDSGNEFLREASVSRILNGEALVITMDEHFCWLIGESIADGQSCADSVKSWVYTDANGFEQLGSFAQ